MDGIVCSVSTFLRFFSVDSEVNECISIMYKMMPNMQENAVCMQCSASLKVFNKFTVIKNLPKLYFRVC